MLPPKLQRMPPALLAGAIVAIADLDTGHTLDHVASVSVERVLAWAWAERRLEECAARLAAGERAPAIRVSRYWLHGLALYTVGDGMHRTVAARQAGRKRISAFVAWESTCRPE